MLWWIFQNSVIAAAMAAVVALLCRWRRFSPAVTHALWLAVLVKLVTPPLVVYSLPVVELPESLEWLVRGEMASEAAHDARTEFGRNGSAMEAGVTAGRTEAERVESRDKGAVVVGWLPVERGADGEWVVVDEEWVNREAGTAGGLPESEMVEGRGSAGRGDGGFGGGKVDGASDPTGDAWRGQVENLSYVVGSCWLAGLVVIGILYGIRLARLWGICRRAHDAPAELTDELAEAARIVGVRAPQLRVTGALYSPAVCALGRAVLLWPERGLEHLSAESRRTVLVHEMAHLRRRDHWVGWVELAAGWWWWWNPLVWYVRHQLDEQAELACDAWVVTTQPSGRRAYAEALIEISEMKVTAGGLVPAVGMGVKTRRTFERRLTMIMREQVRCQVPLAGLVAIGLLAVVVLPGWSAGQSKPATVAELPAPPTAALPADEPAVAETKPPIPAVTPVPPGFVLKTVTDAVVEVIDTGDGTPVLTTIRQVGAPADSDANPLLPAAVVPSPYRPVAAQPVPTGLPQPSPYAASEDRLKKLEDQLRLLLGEVQELRQTRTPRSISGRPLPADSALEPVRTLSKSPATSPKSATTPTKPQPAAEVYGLFKTSRSATTTLSGQPVETLTRATYELPKPKAEALAAFLKEQVAAEIDVKVKENGLQVTATPDVQAAIGHFIHLMHPQTMTVSAGSGFRVTVPKSAPAPANIPVPGLPPGALVTPPLPTEVKN